MKTFPQFQQLLEESKPKNPRDQLPLLKAKYHEFNRNLFDGMLPDVPIEFKIIKGAFALVQFQTTSVTQRGFLNQYKKVPVVPGSIKLIFSTVYDVPEEKLLGTLVHEMIHIYFCANDMPNTHHDMLFMSKLRELQKKVPFKISLNDSAEGYEFSSEVKPKDVYCVMFLRDNRVESVAFFNPNIIKMWDLMQWYKKRLMSSVSFEIWRGQTKLYKRFTLGQKLGGSSYKLSPQIEGQLRRELKIAYDSTNDYSGTNQQNAIAL